MSYDFNIANLFLVMFQVLPMLALYIHLVGDLCRDVQRTVECRILKVSIYVTLNIL